MPHTFIRLLWTVFLLWAASVRISNTPLLGDPGRAFGLLLVFSLIWWGGDAWLSTLRSKAVSAAQTVLHVYSNTERFAHAMPPLAICIGVAVAVQFTEGTTSTEKLTVSLLFVVVGTVIAWRRWRITHAEIGPEQS